MSKDTVPAEKQMVLFKIGNETYGLDISAVHEIIRMQPITKVPKTPFYVKGIINLRGKVIPVIDLVERFGMEKTEKDKNNRIMVVNLQDTTMGIVVDAVTEVLSIPIDSIEPVSDVVATTNTDYLAGIAKLADKMVILLELDKLLSGEGQFKDLLSE
jgi:purine-binding chemotaxis protein CheW